MTDWKECKLGEVSDYVNRGIPPLYVENDGLIVLNQRCIRNGKVDFAQSRFSSKTKKIVNEKQLIKGDILINSTGVGTVGRVAFFNHEAQATVDSHVTIVRVNANKADPKYVFYNIFSMESDIETFAEGSTGQVELNRERIKEISISLPSLPEQRDIAGVLSSLDDKIDLLHRQNKTLEGIAEALWRKMFVEEVDPGWKKKRLGDVCEKITKGTTPTTLKMNFVDEGINFVKVESIDEIGQFIAEKFAHIDEVTHKLLQRSILKENDILYSIAGTIGRIAVVTEEILPANTNQALAIIRLRDIELYLPFVRLLLKTSNMTDDLGSKIVHAVQPNLSLGEIAETEFIMPDERSLVIFNSKVNELFSKINLNNQQIRTLSRLRDTLLPKLMSGEVRVKV